MSLSERPSAAAGAAANGAALEAKLVQGIHQIPAADWDACVGHDQPFLRHAFLAALEESGSACSETGWMPLHLAAYNGDAKTVRVLLDLGADPRADDGTGKTALDWAREAGKAENARLLEEALRR